MTCFDLGPPSPDERRRLEAALTDEEREVLLHHGTERPFCGVFVHQKCRASTAAGLRPAPLPRDREIRQRHGLAELRGAVRPRPPEIRARPQLRHGPHRDPLRALRQPPGPRVPGRPAAHRERYCINSVSLQFTPDGQPLPDPLGAATEYCYPWCRYAAARSLPASGSSRVAPRTSRWVNPPSPGRTCWTGPIRSGAPMTQGGCTTFSANPSSQAIRGCGGFPPRRQAAQDGVVLRALPIPMPGPTDKLEGTCSSPMTTAGASQRSTRGSQARQASERRRRSSCERAITSSCTPRTTCYPCRSTGTSGIAPWRPRVGLHPTGRLRASLHLPCSRVKHCGVCWTRPKWMTRRNANYPCCSSRCMRWRRQGGGGRRTARGRSCGSLPGDRRHARRRHLRDRAPLIHPAQPVRGRHPLRFTARQLDGEVKGEAACQPGELVYATLAGEVIDSYSLGRQLALT